MTQRVINRPQLATPPKPCPCCGQGFVAAWGWVFIYPGRIIDLCGYCARTMRYGAEADRRALLAPLQARVWTERRAA